MAIVDRTYSLLTSNFLRNVSMTSWPQAGTYIDVNDLSTKEFVVGSDKIDLLQTGYLKFDANPAIPRNANILIAGLKNIEALEVNTEALTLEIAAVKLDGRWDFDGKPVGPVEAVGTYCQSFTLRNALGSSFDFVGLSGSSNLVPIGYATGRGAQQFGQACFNHSGIRFETILGYLAGFVLRKTAGTTGMMFVDVYAPMQLDGSDDRPMGSPLFTSIGVDIPTAIPLDDTDTTVPFNFLSPAAHIENIKQVYVLRTTTTRDGVHFVSVVVENRSTVGDLQVGMAIKQEPGELSADGFSDGAYASSDDLPLLHDLSGALIGGTPKMASPGNPRNYVYPHADRVTFAATPFPSIGGVHQWPSTDGTNPTGLEGVIQRWIDDPRYPHGDASLEPIGFVIGTPAGVPVSPPDRERVVLLGTPELFVRYEEPILGCAEFDGAIDDSVRLDAMIRDSVEFESGIDDSVESRMAIGALVAFEAGLSDAVSMQVGLC